MEMLEVLSFPQVFSDSDRGQIESHLVHLLTSEAFSGSRRSCEFLRYIVEETLAGRGTLIKERNIAVDVFRKGVDFDSQTESIVRVKAAEVRKRLAQAYASGLNDQVRINLPLGGYQPVFRFVATNTQSEPICESAAVTNRHFSKQSIWGGIVAAAVVLLCLVGVYSYHWKRSAIDSLWEPFTRQSRPVLISLPTPTVVSLKDAERRMPFHSGDLFATTELITRESYYVGVGAALGAARFSEQLSLRHQSFFLKFGNDVSFSDLRQYPSILLGGSSSHWSVEITGRLPLRIDLSRPGRITDPASNTYWESEPDQSSKAVHVGYALITRLVNSESGNSLLMASGINAYDTWSAVEFLTREEYFNQFATRTPGWQHSNFQVVIRSLIHEHTPGPPTVITSRVW
jgi:hypothetical protein